MISTSIPFQDAIKLSFFDTDGKKVDGLTVEQAKKLSELDSSRLFYFKTGDGTEKELTIDQVKKLTPQKDLLPSSNCSTGPVACGPPLVRFFGGDGFGAAANAVISPISSSVIGFDIVNAGKGFKFPPNAELIDPCGKGSGSYVTVNVEPDDFSIDATGVTAAATGVTAAATGVTAAATGGGTRPRGTRPTTYKIKNITVVAPGDGYLAAPDGSLGGNERVWKEPDDGYVRTIDGSYYVVQPYRPIQARKGSTYYPPDGPSRVLEEDEVITLPLVPAKAPDTTVVGTTYPVLLCIEEIKILDQGFGYRPGDQLIITPDNGTKTELEIDEFGQITGVKILSGGCGYNDFPDIRTNSPTGFNATFSPIFKVTKIEDVGPEGPIIAPEGPFVVPDGANIISVVDCVGKISPKREFDIVPR
jgi:hypothetical protein